MVRPFALVRCFRLCQGAGYCIAKQPKTIRLSQKDLGLFGMIPCHHLGLAVPAGQDHRNAGLKRLGYAVIAAQDGVEALELFRQRREEIRCVLCDLTMPRMDGWETLTALRQIAPGIPVILASGYSEEQAMDGEHTERPHAFIGKPYKIELLRMAFQKALTFEAMQKRRKGSA